MNSRKVSTAHLQRLAYIYIRPSTAAQVEHHRESTDRQYQLIERARGLGWPNDRIKVVDTDLAKSADGLALRSGFDTMFTDVALHNVGLILSIEVSRLARHNSDWYRLLDLCGVTDTLLGDEDGLYHPGLFNDRLLLGLKGTRAEAELHVIRARLNGGSRNKAARGELRRGLPVGLEWGESDGQIRLVPNEAVVDFDSIRVAPPATDLANGMLQFSIVGDRPNPADWPAHFDRDRVFQFLEGYREVIRLSERKRYGLVDLMIESMIAEAVLPVAATGSFGQHSGLDFLEMILRKTKWLRRHRRELREVMLK